MKGFVLAAGLGTRLRPITDHVPKPLLPVGNLPLIGYALKLLASHGITEVAINLHHLGRQIRDLLGDGEPYGVRIVYSEEEEILGTGGGLKQMQAFLNETFVVINADALIDVDLGAVIEAHRAAGALSTMVLREDPRQDEYGLVEIDARSRIRRILGQGAPADDGLRPLMFTGVHVMEPRFLDYIPAGVNTCVNRYAYPKALQNDEHLLGYVNEGFFSDVGTPERYLGVNFAALDLALPLRHAEPLAGFALAPKKEVGEVVRMGEDVQLGASVRLVPPLVLCDGVRVGDDATVGPYCVLGPKASVGKGATLSHAVTLAGAKVEPGASLRRVIVGKKALLQAETAEAEGQPS